MRTLDHPASGRPHAGGALVMTLIAVTVLAAMAGTVLTVNSAHKKEIEASRNRMRAIYLAEAGIAEALGTLYASGIHGEEIPAGFGDREAPRESEAGEFWSALSDNGDGTYTAHSTGVVNGRQRSLEVTVLVDRGSVYDHAIFAGNSSGDSRYALKLGGNADEADDIRGDVYSGGHIVRTGDAAVDGDLTAASSIQGEAGEEGVALPIPDIPGMDYAANHDVDVAALFASGDEAWQSDDAGGFAWQLPEASPGHIFRKNPTDRSNVLGRNGKDDFFLEDPYEPVRQDSSWDGSDAFPVTLSGTAGDPGEDTSNAVFYIDGNLWIHNIPTYSFKFVHDDGEAVNCTFVVRGNIYFSDNVFYDDPGVDGVAFIAIRDEDVDDTGNIYFGDPQGGTLEYLDGFMYAENDFIDMNLSADGSARVTVNGNMTAGNHVAIERDFGDHHSKLTVVFDDRIKNDAIDLPGLPMSDLDGRGGLPYSVVAWREVPSDRDVGAGESGDAGGGDGCDWGEEDQGAGQGPTR